MRDVNLRAQGEYAHAQKPNFCSRIPITDSRGARKFGSHQHGRTEEENAARRRHSRRTEQVITVDALLLLRLSTVPNIFFSTLHNASEPCNCGLKSDFRRGEQ